MTEPRKVYDVRLKRSFPFVELYKREESSREMAAASLFLLLVVVVGIYVSGDVISMLAVAAGSFVAGGMAERWRSWEKIYG